MPAKKATPSGKVAVKKSHIAHVVGSKEFTIDILTGGSKPPQVTLASNSRFPFVRDFYASATKVESDTGPVKVVRLHVRFDSPIPPNAGEMKFNLFQEDASEFLFPFF